MHAKTDSEVTSLAPSSPPRSPARNRPVYYVQSPSRDSHDGEKTLTSVHSTPALTPLGSPRHSVGHTSSASRFSGGLKNENGSGKNGERGKKPAEGRHIDAIEEEGLLEDDEQEKGIPRKCYYLLFVAAFLVLFSFFALVLWGASRSQKPQITMKSITFEGFIIQAGTDASLVPTDMSTVNSTVKFTFRNAGTFFGVRASASSLELTYSQLTLAHGDMAAFEQPRASQRTVSVAVAGDKVPLYGGGPSLTTTAAAGKPSAAAAPVPMNLSFVVTAKAYVLGELVKPTFTAGVQCGITLHPDKLNSPLPLDRACQIYYS